MKGELVIFFLQYSLLITYVTIMQVGQGENRENTGNLEVKYERDHLSHIARYVREPDQGRV